MSSENHQRRPSFVVITAASGVDRPTLEAALNVWPAEHGPPEHGPALAPLGENRFVMSRPAMKRMLAGKDWNSLCRQLIEMKKVIGRVRLEGADAVLADYRGRRVSTPQQGGSESRKFWKPGECWALEDVGTRKPATATDEPCRRIRLAHLDTGYTKHPVFGVRSKDETSILSVEEGVNIRDLGERPLEGRSDADTSVLAVEEGVNFIEPGELPPLEALSHAGSPAHGTETLSLIIRALRNDTSRDVAAGCTIIPYRVTDSEAIETSEGSAALERAIRHAAFDAVCDVICIPLGDPCPPAAGLAEQIDAAYDAGVIIIAAAGEITGEVAYPGRYRRVITVSGTTPYDRPWLSAARGRAVDICARATEISVATAGLIDGQICYQWRQVDGTSYAAAKVAGAATLWLARQASWLYRDWRLVEAFRTCLAESARRPAFWDDRLWGAGILDVPSLLRRRLPDPAALTAAPAAAAQKW